MWGKHCFEKDLKSQKQLKKICKKIVLVILPGVLNMRMQNKKDYVDFSAAISQHITAQENTLRYFINFSR